MINEVDYLRELFFLSVNPLTWLLAFVLTRNHMSISTILLSASSAQILSIILPYLFLQSSHWLFSIHSAVLLLLLSLCTGSSIGFFVYGVFAPREHTRRLTNQ